MSTIVSRPDVMGGEPCIAGTRIPARAIKSFHEDGYDTAGILREYPTLSAEQVAAALDYKPVKESYFTLVFQGDIRKFKGNPLRTETPFGIPFAAGIGNAFAECDELREALDAANAPE